MDKFLDEAFGIIKESKYIDHLVYLWGRWQDEKEYEDFEDYKKSASKSLPKGMDFVRMTKRPFAVTFAYKGADRHMKLSVTSRKYSLQYV